MKELAKATLLSIYKYSGAIAAQERISYKLGQRFMPIILFHRVTDDIPPDGLTVTTEWFRGFCKLMSQRFNPVSLSEAMGYINSGQGWPRRTVAITFDDCYRDNLFAARELAKHKLSACFFVPTAYPGTDHVFEWDAGLPRMANLTWDEVRAMADLGHEIGSHTVHHADCGQINADELRQELRDSRETLERELRRPVQWFAYPYGQREHFLQERLPLVYEAGYGGCFSGFGGFVYPKSGAPNQGRARRKRSEDSLPSCAAPSLEQIIPRVPVPYFRSLLNLELYLTGCLDWVYALKRKVGMI